jgi:hypothetical protein
VLHKFCYLIDSIHRRSCVLFVLNGRVRFGGRLKRYLIALRGAKYVFG